MNVLKNRREALTRVGLLSLVLLLGVTACGDDGGETTATTVPTANTYDVEAENDPDLANYRIVRLAEFSDVSLGDADVVTYQETYDYLGNHWECSVTLMDNSYGGGPAKSCIVTPLDVPTTTSAPLG